MEPDHNPNVNPDAMASHDDVLRLTSIVKMPLMKLPATSVALRTSRGVVLISPGKNISDYSAVLQNFGRVTDIVAPNQYHHLGIHAAIGAYPQATLWCTAGLKKKRSDVVWDKVIDSKTWSYSDEITALPILGAPKVGEWVFFHSASKTLVVTDLFFNLIHAKGAGSWILLKLFGTYRKFGVSSFYLRMVTDQEAFKSSLLAVSKLNFTSIVMSHGEPITSDAKARFMAALKARDLI